MVRIRLVSPRPGPSRKMLLTVLAVKTMAKESVSTGQSTRRCGRGIRMGG